MRNFSLIAVIIACLCSLYAMNSSAGLVKKQFLNNTQISLTLSNTDVNKIVIAEDEVTGVHGATNMATFKNDSQGGLYLSTQQTTPFTVFVTTKNNHPFSLLVIPKREPGETYLLTPESQGNNQAAEQWESSTAYETLLVDTMRAIVNNKTPKNFVSVPVGHAFSIAYQGGTLKPDGLWQGYRVIAIRYVIHNASSKPEVLSERDFYTTNVMAVALSQQTLPPKSQGYVYEILSSGNRGQS